MRRRRWCCPPPGCELCRNPESIHRPQRLPLIRLPFTRRLPADDVSAGGEADRHPIAARSGCASAGHVGADVVAQHAVAGRPKALDQDAGAPIPADDVAHAGLCTAHHVVVCAEADMDPELPIAQRLRCRSRRCRCSCPAPDWRWRRRLRSPHSCSGSRRSRRCR